MLGTRFHFSSPPAQKSISEGSRKKPITERDERLNGGGREQCIKHTVAKQGGGAFIDTVPALGAT